MVQLLISSWTILHLEIMSQEQKSETNSTNKEVIFQHFWVIDAEGKISIHHQGLIEFFSSRGFCWLDTDGDKQLIQKKGNIIEATDITSITNYAYRFIMSDVVPDELGNGATRQDLLNLFVRGIDNYINNPKLRLLPIVKLKLHRDTPEKSFFYFNNGVVKVTATTITMDSYTALGCHVWKSQIKNRDFTLLPADDAPGDFATFSFRICDENPDKFESLQTIIGYILHRYWMPSKSVIPCLLDETVVGDDEAQGGTGKTLLCQGFSYVRNMVDVDGKNFKASKDFAFQRVTSATEILFVDDLSRSSVFEDWFSIISTGVEVNQKFKASFKIDREYSPKIIITSNFPIRSLPGNSTERRKIELEIGTYYGADKQPKDEFGRDFFEGWDDVEYNKMFNFFARCTQKYLTSGIISPPSKNMELRRLISELGSPDLLQFLDEKMYMRVENRFNKKDLFAEFLSENPGQKRFYTSQNRFIRKVHKYFEYKKMEYTETPAATKKIINITGWGDIPMPDDTTEEVPTSKLDTLADKAHDYMVIDAPENNDNVTS